MSPQVSIITPTANREHMLPAISRCVLRQRVDWEWLILDDSPMPSPHLSALAAQDQRIRYEHSTETLSIGAKRNRLIERARAPVIAHFDDDDHYTSHYLLEMLRILTENNADLVKLSHFFSYAPAFDFFGFMDLTQKVGLHFVITGASFNKIEFHDKMKIGDDFILFYGFSYVYRKAVTEIAHFDDVNLCEDESFIKRVVHAGKSVIAADDPKLTCLHLIHPTSTSTTFARYIMPSFLIQKLFPEFEGVSAQR